MVSEKLTVTNQMGFHMRPANVFVSAMAKYKSEVLIEFNGKEVNGKSIMNIMAACIKCGSESEIRCIGEDEADALKEAVELVKSGLGDEN